MVVAGVHEGKNEICARVGYFNLGINLATEKPTPVQIKNAVEKILANTTYRTNVEQLSKEFNRYHPGELCGRYVAAVLSQSEKSQPAVIVNDVAA